MIKFDYTQSGVKEKDLARLSVGVSAVHTSLHTKAGAGSEHTGWLDLPKNYDKTEFGRIMKAAVDIRAKSDVLLVCGVGGSYLGARAGLEYVRGNLHNFKDDMQVFFIGNSLSSDYLADLIEVVAEREICLNVISKSGTTLEPALAFRVLRDLMEQKYGDKAAERIYATTDKERGALKSLADANGYKTFVVPDDVGGRFSVLTAVGLLPLAVAGLDIQKLMDGAKAAMERYANEDLMQNDCYKYAVVRNLLLKQGKNIEILASFEPSLQYLAEWWKQLFGESEGKEHKGIFPASVQFSADLHSMGQYIQDGQRNLFETVIKVGARREVMIREADDDSDGLEFLEGKGMTFVNEMARQGTLAAHVGGGVPNLVIEVERRDEESLGELFYFFEKACAISGYLLGVNPFDQPGVEEYKKNMFELMRA